MIEFMFSKMTQPKRNLVRSLITNLSETLSKLLREGLINFSNEFLKTS